MIFPFGTLLQQQFIQGIKYKNRKSPVQRTCLVNRELIQSTRLPVIIINQDQQILFHDFSVFIYPISTRYEIMSFFNSGSDKVSCALIKNNLSGSIDLLYPKKEGALF